MLNEALRTIRLFHDLKQKDMARRLDVSASYLSEIEKGTKEPTLALLRKYAEEFNLPLSSVLFFSEHLSDGVAADRVRSAVSSKVLTLLKFIAQRSGRDAA